MNKLLFSFLMSLFALTAGAVPAKPGVWKSITLENGTTVRAQLSGDEFMHFYVGEDGTRYVADESTGMFRVQTDASLSELGRRAVMRRMPLASRMKPASKRREAGKSVFQGTKKGLVILAQFSDVKFQSSYGLGFFKNIVNGINFSSGNYGGSVRDYFRAQSNGQFDLDFDVVGPCPLKHQMSYYGRNVSNEDAHAGEMVAEACIWAHENGIDFSQYDWDGDGYVDQVFVVYAGYGEADGGASNTIWPHMYYLSESDYGKTLEYNGVTIDTYACANELSNSSHKANGIGTFCHEFSHCMGFPDLYDSNYNGWFGMNQFDLMDSGNYNNDGFTPAGYSAYEKNECGWITLHDMTDIKESEHVSGLKPVSQYGDAYIIKNKGNNDEYYVVEYRKRDAWDRYLPGEGVMVTHVDYDKDIWDWNVPNTKNGVYYASDDVNLTNRLTNTHPRLTIFHADNDETTWSLDTDLYPSDGNHSLSPTSIPSASVYTKNSNGTRYMHVAVNDIELSADKSTASMTFAPVGNSGGTDPSNPSDGTTVFYESFDKCSGTGGNDNLWSGNIANANANTDRVGWESTNGSIRGANKCIKLGTSSKAGTVTSPSFSLDGTATLTFKAGAWDSAKDGTQLTLSTSAGSIDETEFTMQHGAWTEFTTTLSANGLTDITFSTSGGRFFLDEVKVVGGSSSGVNIVPVDGTHKVVAGYYSLDGTRLQAPQRGMTIVRYADGSTRKVVMK